jgi:type I restriction enzyme S subunit
MNSDTPPLDWEAKKLGEVVSFGSGYGFPRSLQGLKDEEIPFFKVSDMSTEGNERNLTLANHYVSLEVAGNEGWAPFPAGAIAFAKVGAALLLNRRRLLTQPSLVDNNMMVAIPGEGIDSVFLYWWLNIVDFAIFVQSGVVPSVNQRQVGSLSIALPPFSEQRRIAEILDAADEAIRQTERVIAKLREVKRGLLHDLLTRGLDADGNLRDPVAHPEQFKDSSLGRIPREWEARSLDSCVGTRITYGIVQAGPHIRDGVPYIRTGDITDGQLTLEGLLRTSEEIAASYKRSEVHTGEIVCAIRATVGEVVQVPPELDGANLTQGTARIAPIPAINNRFLLWALRSDVSQRQFDMAVKGTTFREITLGALRKLEVALPEKREEQDKLVAVLDVHDARIRAEEAVLAKRRQVKRGLMEDLLTGRVRV